MPEHDAVVMILFKDLDLFYLFRFGAIPLKQHIEMRAAENVACCCQWQFVVNTTANAHLTLQVCRVLGPNFAYYLFRIYCCSLTYVRFDKEGQTRKVCTQNIQFNQEPVLCSLVGNLFNITCPDLLV